MNNSINSIGCASCCQSPRKPFPQQERRTTYDVIQDVIAMEKASKLAERIEELNSKPAEELTGLERAELAYYNALKTIAKFNNLYGNSIVIH